MDSLEETRSLFRQGNSLPEIAFKRKLAFSTIEDHFARLIADKKIKVEELVKSDIIDLVKKAVEGNSQPRLKELKEKLPQEITFAEIKWTLVSIGKYLAKGYKMPIIKAINSYRGNYCFRKCFNHEGTIAECGKKFGQFAETFGTSEIFVGEFFNLMKTGQVKICKLPEEKRKQTVFWHEFEKMHKSGKDLWD